jgi:hypothetical protein
MSLEIDLKGWLFPDGGVWFIYSLDDQRPSISCCNPDDQAKSEVGIFCFMHMEIAGHYLEIVCRDCNLDPMRFPIRYVQAEDLVPWLEEVSRWAPYLVWPLRHQLETPMVHLSVPIVDLLTSSKAQ